MVSNELPRTEGIILHHIPYRNDDQILTLFTLDQGLLKLFCNKAKARGQRYTPLMKVEIIYQERRSEIFGCEEISVLKSYLNLRNELSHLQVGCEMIRAINMSQLIGRAAPLLYQLMVYYLDKIPLMEDPWALLASFKLKILKHEGILPQDLAAIEGYRFEGEELDQVYILAHTQNYQQLSLVNLSQDLRTKLDHFFLEEMR